MQPLPILTTAKLNGDLSDEEDRVPAFLLGFTGTPPDIRAIVLLPDNTFSTRSLDRLEGQAAAEILRAMLDVNSLDLLADVPGSDTPAEECSQCGHDAHVGRCMQVSQATGRPIAGDPVCACTHEEDPFA